MMSRKDYQRAATLLRETPTDPETREWATEVFVTFFTGDNPRFSRDRFLAAVEGKVAA